VQDSFTAPDGTILDARTPAVGGLWVRQQGAGASVTANTLRPTSSILRCGYLNTAAVGARELELSFTISALFVANGFITQRQPNGDYYFAIYTGTQYEIGKIVGGVLTTLVSLVQAAPSLPAVFMLRVRKGDDYLRLLVDGVEKVATNDLTLSGGLSGILCQSFSGTTIIDDFLADDTAPGQSIRLALDALAALELGLSIADPIVASPHRAWKYMPAQEAVLPDGITWANVWTLTDISYQPSNQVEHYDVNVKLYIKDADVERAADIATAFYQAFLNALGQSLTLGGTVKSHEMHGGDPTLAGLSRGGMSYMGLDLHLLLTLETPTTFAA